MPFSSARPDPDDPKVEKVIGQLGMPGISKIPKSMHLVIAQLAFGNSDLAFQGNHLFQGNFYGMNIYDISNPANTKLLTSMVCPGGQGDVSVYKNLLFMSVEMPNGRLDCGTEGFAPGPPPTPEEEKDKEKMKKRIPAAEKERFRGVRIFDISDIKNPKQVAAVQTCRGSHTHTLVVDPNDKDNVYVYVSGTSFVRQPEELAGCSGEKPDKDPNTALFRIDVIKVPVAAPQEAKIVSSPRVFIDPRTGAMNGLNNGGTHGKKAAAKTRGHRPMPRHHGLFSDRPRRRRLLRQRNSARHQGSGSSQARRCGERSQLFLLALRFFLKRWKQSGLHR